MKIKKYLIFLLIFSSNLIANEKSNEFPEKKIFNDLFAINPNYWIINSLPHEFLEFFCNPRKKTYIKTLKKAEVQAIVNFQKINLSESDLLEKFNNSKDFQQLIYLYMIFDKLNISLLTAINYNNLNSNSKKINLYASEYQFVRDYKIRGNILRQVVFRYPPDSGETTDCNFFRPFDGNLKKTYIQFCLTWLKPVCGINIFSNQKFYSERFDIEAYWQESKEIFMTFVNKRDKLSSFTTKFYLQFLRANHVESSLANRQKIQDLASTILNLPNETAFLTFVAIYANKINYFSSENCTNKFYNEIAKNIKSNKRNILITESELLYKFAQLSPEFREKILISTESVVEDPDFMPTSKNQFYEAVIRFIYKYREIFWSEKEFEKLYERANPIAKYWIQEFRDNPSKAEF